MLQQLEGLDWKGKIDLRDAVAVYRTDDGRLRIDQSVRATSKEGGAGGELLGAMLGAILAAPFTVGASTAGAAVALAAGAATFGTAGAAIGGTFLLIGAGKMQSLEPHVHRAFESPSRA